MNISVALLYNYRVTACRFPGPMVGRKMRSHTTRRALRIPSQNRKTNTVKELEEYDYGVVSVFTVSREHEAADMFP